MNLKLPLESVENLIVTSLINLLKRGFITLSLGTTQTTKEKTYSIYYPTINNASLQPLSALAYAAANAWEALAKVPDVDSTKNWHCRTFIWREMGNVCILPL